MLLNWPTACLAYQSPGHKLSELCKPGMLTRAYDPSTQEMEAGRLGVRDPPELHSEFEASLGCMTLCLEEAGWGKAVFRINKKCSEWTSDLILLTRLAKAFPYSPHPWSIIEWLRTRFLTPLSAEGSSCSCLCIWSETLPMAAL